MDGQAGAHITAIGNDLSRASVAFHVAAETPAGVLRETANILPEIA